MRSIAIVQPTAPRHVTTKMGGTLRITLPSRKVWMAIVPNSLFVIVWLAVITGASVTLGALLFGGTEMRLPSLADSVFLLGFFTIWLGLFSVGGLTSLYTVLWNLAGREVIEVSRQSMRLSRVVPGWARSKEYLAEHIRDLRVSPQTLPNFYRHQVGFFGLGAGQGQLAFDYGARTIRCLDADEAEVKLVLAEIRQRFPQLYGPADNA